MTPEGAPGYEQGEDESYQGMAFSHAGLSHAAASRLKRFRSKATGLALIESYQGMAFSHAVKRESLFPAPAGRNSKS